MHVSSGSREKKPTKIASFGQVRLGLLALRIVFGCVGHALGEVCVISRERQPFEGR